MGKIFYTLKITNFEIIFANHQVTGLYISWRYAKKHMKKSVITNLQFQLNSIYGWQYYKHNG